MFHTKRKLKVRVELLKIVRVKYKYFALSHTHAIQHILHEFFYNMLDYTVSFGPSLRLCLSRSLCLFASLLKSMHTFVHSHFNKSEFQLAMIAIFRQSNFFFVYKCFSVSFVWTLMWCGVLCCDMHACVYAHINNKPHEKEKLFDNYH